MGDFEMETYAPIFPGFYETAYSFEIDIHDAVESVFDEMNTTMKLFHELANRDYDKLFKENYNGYRENVAKTVCEFLSEKISDMLKVNVQVEFQNIYSPMYYNFKNDSINVNLKIDDEDLFMKNLLSFVKNHFDKFKQYIESNYTSYDGFLSHYSNNANEWVKNEYNAHEIGSILEFALRTYYNDIETDMMYYVLENVYSFGYIDVQEKFKEVIESDEFDCIVKEYDKLLNQKENYLITMKNHGKYPNMNAINKQTEKVTDEICSQIFEMISNM